MANGVVTSSKYINEVFEKFYKDLYTSTCKPDTEEAETFFAGHNLPTISKRNRKKLELRFSP